MKCRNIYISRHGIMCGQLPHWAKPCDSYRGPNYDAPLSPQGREQAEAFAERMQSVPLDHIFSSPYRRAIETVAPLAKQKGLPIKIEQGIGEFLIESLHRDFATMPTPKERAEQFPGVTFDMGHRSAVIPERVEVREDYQKRVGQTVTSLVENYGPNILLVAHGSCAKYTGQALNGAMPITGGSHCAVSHLMRSGDSWKLILDNDVTYLKSWGLYIPPRVKHK